MSTHSGSDEQEKHQHQAQGRQWRLRDIVQPNDAPEWCQTFTSMNGALVWRFLKERLQPKTKPTSE